MQANWGVSTFDCGQPPASIALSFWEGDFLLPEPARSATLGSETTGIRRMSDQSTSRALDYDKTEIAATYDKARALAPERVRLWRDLLSAHVNRSAVSLVLDLGCGTGRLSALLAEHLGVR
jgi:SAM-dependent methyltransferase